MARPEWLRTFVAVYRSGSITEAARLRALLGRNEVDIAVTSSVPASQSISAASAGAKRFILVGPSSTVRRRPERFRSLGALGFWLAERPRIAFSKQLPINRRFWVW